MSGDGFGLALDGHSEEISLVPSSNTNFLCDLRFVTLTYFYLGSHLQNETNNLPFLTKNVCSYSNVVWQCEGFGFFLKIVLHWQKL